MLLGEPIVRLHRQDEAVAVSSGLPAGAPASELDPQRPSGEAAAKQRRLRASLDVERAKNRTLEQEVQKLKSELGRLAADLDVERAKNHASDQAIEMLKSELASESQKVKDANQQVQSLTQLDQEHVVQIAQLQQKARATSEENERLRYQAQEHQEMIATLQEANGTLTNETTEMQEKLVASTLERTRLCDEQLAQQRIIDSLSKEKDNFIHGCLRQRELEVRLEERTEQHAKLEQENLRLRGEFSDVVSTLISTSRASSSDSEGARASWQVVSASTAAQASGQKAKKTRRSLKNRRGQQKPEQTSIPDTTGEYQD